MIPEVTIPNPSKDVSPKPPEAEPAGCLSTLARIIWIMVGNFALLVLLVLIVQRRSFTYIDLIFWAVVAAVLFIRYADIKWLEGLGADAQPATMKDWTKYARLLIIVAGGAWVVAHALLLLLRR
jgi:hypothetical protein